VAAAAAAAVLLTLCLLATDIRDNAEHPLYMFMVL
jgi:hypothetical protein